MSPYRTFRHRRSWYTQPPYSIGGGVFFLFVLASIWTGCNSVLHRTPEQKAAIAAQDANWSFVSCRDFTRHARNERWNLTSTRRIELGNGTHDDYTATKGHQKVTFTCDADDTKPAQNVCFTVDGSPTCATKPWN